MKIPERFYLILVPDYVTPIFAENHECLLLCLNDLIHELTKEQFSGIHVFAYDKFPTELPILTNMFD